MIPEFMRFYGYTLAEVMGEYARTFYSLINSMYQIKAQEALEAVSCNNATDDLVSAYKKQAKGLHGVVQEVKIARSYQ